MPKAKTNKPKLSGSAQTVSELMALAERYQVADNALFVSAVNQYALQQEVIQSIRDSLTGGDEDGLLVDKEYVKGRKNLYANPLVKELPKHSDSANKTLAMMLDIIVKLGKEKADDRSRLEQLIDE